MSERPGKSESPPRQCPECGCDRWAMRDAQRRMDLTSFLYRRVEKLAADNGLLTYRLKVIEIEHRDALSRVSRKIVRQARVIVRMEAKLRALKAKPYEGAPLGESAPAAEYDAHHRSA